MGSLMESGEENRSRHCNHCITLSTVHVLIGITASATDSYQQQPTGATGGQDEVRSYYNSIHESSKIPNVQACMISRCLVSRADNILYYMLI